MNKPKGCVTTCSDEKGRRTVLDILYRVAPEIRKHRVYPVGRLDYDTEGLLLLTNDGEFYKRIAHPSAEVEKEYVAIVDDGKEVRVTIKEGKNRQVRKMLANDGYDVKSLKRVRIGRLELGELGKGGVVVLDKAPVI